MTTLTIYDTILVPRPVEIPDACPKCQASFLTGTNLTEWDLAEVQYRGDLQGDAYLVDHEDDRGEIFHPVAYYCASCCHRLTSAAKRELEPANAPPSVMALLPSSPVHPSF